MSGLQCTVLSVLWSQPDLDVSSFYSCCPSFPSLSKLLCFLDVTSSLQTARPFSPLGGSYRRLQHRDVWSLRGSEWEASAGAAEAVGTGCLSPRLEQVRKENKTLGHCDPQTHRGPGNQCGGHVGRGGLWKHPLWGTLGGKKGGPRKAWD